MAQNYREMAPEAIGHWNASAVFLCVSLFVAPGIPSGRRDLRVVFWFFYFHFCLKVDLGRGEKKMAQECRRLKNQPRATPGVAYTRPSVRPSVATTKKKRLTARANPSRRSASWKKERPPGDWESSPCSPRPPPLPPPLPPQPRQPPSGCGQTRATPTPSR